MKKLVVVLWIALVLLALLWSMKKMNLGDTIWGEFPRLAGTIDSLLGVATSPPGKTMLAMFFITLLSMTFFVCEPSNQIDHDACDIGPDLSEHCD